MSCVIANRLDDPRVRGIVLTARDLGPAERAQARRLRFRERLLELAIQPKSDFTHALTTILRTASDVLDVGAVSFWRLSADGESLHCESLFDRGKDRFLRDWVGRELTATRFPAYFAQLMNRQPIIVSDTHTSRLTTSFSGDRNWSRVRAMLDTPVLVDGQVSGVLSLQHFEAHPWDDDDESFANTTSLMLALALEVAQRQEAETQHRALAWYDPLTGLPNRNLLRETMRDMIMTAGNRHRRLAVILVDLDRFKDVNDTHGHVIGDALIRAAGEVLRELIGDTGMVARLGGDEFVVLLHDFEHRQEVALLAARLTQTLNRSDLVPNVETQVSASIGVALFPEHGRDMGTLLKNADSAVYQAKRDGRNQFSFFNPIRYERASREVQLGIQLLKAVQADRAEFFIEYQPQVEMATGRVVGFEALIRWMHPAYGRLTPDRFIGVAEVSGLSERITRWVFNEVCAQIVRWRQERPGFDLPVAVNVAGREMSSAALADAGAFDAAEAWRRAGHDRHGDYGAHAGEGRRGQQRRYVRAGQPRHRSVARRFRYRLFDPGLPEAHADRVDQDRPVVRGGHPGRRGQLRDRQCHARSGASLQAQGGCRGDRNARAGRVPAQHRLRVRARLALRARFAGARRLEHVASRDTRRAERADILPAIYCAGAVMAYTNILTDPRARRARHLESTRTRSTRSTTR